VTRTFFAPARLNSSAAAVVYGPTVDEPSAVIVPVSLPNGVVAAAATVASSPAAAIAPAATSRHVEDLMVVPSPLVR
jgi:hypothetical protein